MIEKYGKDTEFSVSRGYSGVDEQIFKILEREETDEEYASRLRSEQWKLEQEIAQFEMLKRRFGESGE